VARVQFCPGAIAIICRLVVELVRQEAIRAQLLAEMPEDLHEGHKWLMAKVAALDLEVLVLQREFEATEDRDRQMVFRATIDAYKVSRTILMEEAARLLGQILQKLPNVDPAVVEVADDLAEQARAERGVVREVARRHAREARARRTYPARPPVVRRWISGTRPRPQGRRESHIARATSSADSGSDGPEAELDPPGEAGLFGVVPPRRALRRAARRLP
jgi:hypothetical protein